MEKIEHYKKDGTVEQIDTGRLSRTIQQPKMLRMEEVHKYRERCLNGEPHPLNIEMQNYELVIIEEMSIDKLHMADYNMLTCRYEVSSHDQAMLIQSVTQRPHVMWAIDNSFDGLYVARRHDHSYSGVKFLFGVYLKDELATFWRLKYMGNK